MNYFSRFQTNPETNHKTWVSSTESKAGEQGKSCYRSETKGYYEGEENRPRHFSLIKRERKTAAGLQQSERLSCLTAQPFIKSTYFNTLNAELNPICYLLALLGAHHFLHVSRIRVKLLTFRLLMSYIYIWSTHS